MTWFLIVAHLYYIIEFYFNDQVAKKHLLSLSTFFPEFLSTIYSFVTFLLLYKLVDSLFSKSRGLRVGANLVFLYLFAYVTSYYFGANHGLDYGLLRETFHDGTAKVIVEIAAHWLDPTPFVIAGIATVFFIYYEFKKRIISRQPKLTPKWIISGFILYLGIIVAPYPSKDEVTHFFQTIYAYYFRPLYPQLSLPKDSFPYVKEELEYSDIAPNAEKPHIFLILVESFNAWAVDAKTPDGRELTPYFNKLKKEGVFIDHYYSHSVLSIKGFGSIFASVLPAVQGIILRDGTNLYGLPDMLEDNGYTSLVFHARLDHTYEPSMKLLGFRDYTSLVDVVREEDDQYRKPTWGYEDRVLYKHMFEDLDQRSKTDDGPFFSTAITIYTHVSFQVPENRRFLVKEPQSLKEKFYNGIHLTDQSLEMFFEELKKRDYLKNSLVIITGDHGYPLGDHGITWTEAGIYDESFRVPFLMVWPGVLEPKTITAEEGVYGHIDFTPTIVDLLNIKLKQHHMLGRSIFLPPEDRSIPLIQPYSGMYLESIRYPYKYIKHMRTGKEVVYNLATDPLEKTPLKQPDMSMFKDDLSPIFLNQYLIKNNQIWQD